jgi:hypothetical protein
MDGRGFCFGPAATLERASSLSSLANSSGLCRLYSRVSCLPACLHARRPTRPGPVRAASRFRNPILHARTNKSSRPPLHHTGTARGTPASYRKAPPPPGIYVILLNIFAERVSNHHHTKLYYRSPQRNYLSPQHVMSSSTKHPTKDALIANCRSASRHPPLSAPY